MKFPPTQPVRLQPWAAAVAAAWALASLVACAQPAPAVALRVLMQTVDAPANAEALQQRLAAAAGMPVHELAAHGPRSWSFSLQCPSSAACTQALQRLQQQGDWVREAREDTRRSLPRRPAGDSPASR